MPRNAPQFLRPASPEIPHRRRKLAVRAYLPSNRREGRAFVAVIARVIGCIVALCRVSLRLGVSVGYGQNAVGRLCAKAGGPVKKSEGDTLKRISAILN
jgi:hypothetical protein